MIEIRAEWDDEAQVWVATSDDVPGLVTEAPTIEALVERLRAIIPELMELNRGIVGTPFAFHVTGERALNDLLNGMATAMESAAETLGLPARVMATADWSAGSSAQN